MTKRRIIGCTGPSYFSAHVLETIEKFYEANPLQLCQNRVKDIHHWVDQCDGVILAGGKDIHPRTYGYAVLNDYGFSYFDVKRDFREIHVIGRCFEKNIPILGICRGHQMLGVYHGIKFICDLSESVLCHQPNNQKISHAKEEPMHWVCLLDEAGKEFEAQDEMADVLPGVISSHERYLWVNSFHHQALWHVTQAEEKKRWESEEGEDKPYEPSEWREHVEVLGYAAGVKKRKIVELMRGITNSWVSCQWHPEYDWEVNAASTMVLSRFGELMDKGRTPPPQKRRRRRNNR